MGNRAVANWGHINICNTQHVENATSPFSVFFYFSIKMTFAKNLIENLLRCFILIRHQFIFVTFFKIFQISTTCLTQFCYLATLHSKMTVQYFSNFRLFSLTILKLKVNFCNLYHMRYWHLNHSKLRLHKEAILSKNRPLKGYTENHTICITTL